MVDMAQADRTLRQQHHTQYDICWIKAINLAAKAMGYSHCIDVPDAEITMLKIAARKIQITGIA